MTQSTDNLVIKCNKICLLCSSEIAFVGNEDIHTVKRKSDGPTSG